MTDDVTDRLNRLESLVEQQQEIIEEQRERIAALEAEPRTGATGTDDSPAVVDRRDALKAGGLLALLLGGVGTASANPQGKVGTSDDPLQALYTEELNGGVTGEQTVTNLAGDGLTLTDGALSPALGSGLGVDASDRLQAMPSRSDVDTSTISLSPGGTAARPPDERSEGGSSRKGIAIEPQVPTDSIEVRVSEKTSGETTVYLTERDDNVLTSTESPGATNYTTLSYPLSAGSRYNVEVDAGGEEYQCGRTVAGDLGEPQFRSPAVYIIGGSGSFDDAKKGIDRVRVSPELSGTRTVEWDAPDSVSRWEAATYRAIRDGETVDVFVETDDGSGWETWDPGGDGSPAPIAPGTDLSAIPASSRVRFRVELSRSDGSNDPRVTMVTRQWRP